MKDGGLQSRELMEQLAWRPWKLIGEGRVADGLAVFHDDGTWWEMAGRKEQPMHLMKAVLAEILSVVPMTFELVGSIVEGNRVALMMESNAPIDDENTYHNAYTMITTIDADRECITAVREYVDTLHAATVLMPPIAEAIQTRGGEWALMKVLSGGS